MMHVKRVFRVVDVALASELATKLTEMTWCPCDGFRHGKHLYLNDATSPDGAQEYAVVRESDGVQVESITFSWCSHGEAYAFIVNAEDGDFAKERLATLDLSRALSHGKEPCYHCA